MNKIDEFKKLLSMVDPSFHFVDNSTVYKKNLVMMNKMIDLTKECTECKKLYELNVDYLYGKTNKIKGV